MLLRTPLKTNAPRELRSSSLTNLASHLLCFNNITGSYRIDLHT